MSNKMHQFGARVEMRKRPVGARLEVNAHHCGSTLRIEERLFVLKKREKNTLRSECSVYIYIYVHINIHIYIYHIYIYDIYI